MAAEFKWKNVIIDWILSNSNIIRQHIILLVEVNVMIDKIRVIAGTIMYMQ